MTHAELREIAIAIARAARGPADVATLMEALVLMDPFELLDAAYIFAGFELECDARTNWLVVIKSALDKPPE